MFILTLCQVGAEAALKQELLRDYPEFRFAYSRPGFVTFKRADQKPIGPDFELRSVFARSYCAFVAKSAANVDDVVQAAETLGKGQPLRLHVSKRDLKAPGNEMPDEDPFADVDAVEKLIRDKAPQFFLKGRQAKVDDCVLDVIIIDEKEWWIGQHHHRAVIHSTDPGGRPRLVVPEEAPSRAYLKLAEGIRWSQSPVLAGQVAVEIGSAPGGAAYYLLEKGLSVVGIDPGQMAPIIYARFGDRFEAITAPVATVLREDLPAEIDWLLADMNVLPSVTLAAVDRLSSRMGDHLMGVLLTLKLNEWKIAEEIPSILAHLKAMGMVRIRAKQLSSNRQEFFVAGWTRRGKSIADQRLTT